MLTPLNKKVIVAPEEAKTMTEGGLHIPEMAKDKPARGTFVSISKDCDSEMVEGDTVIYGKFAGTEIEYEDKKYLIVNEKDVIGILNDD